MQRYLTITMRNPVVARCDPPRLAGASGVTVHEWSAT